MQLIASQLMILGKSTTPLKILSKRESPVESRWAKQQRIKLQSEPNKMNGHHVSMSSILQLSPIKLELL